MEIALPSANETERLRALEQTGLLDTLPEAAFDDVTEAAARICQVPIAAISFVDRDRQWFKSVRGMDVRETPRDLSFCAHTLEQDTLLTIPDTHHDERFMDNPLVTGESGIRFYAGAPLVTSDGHNLGALCVIDRVPRRLTPEQEAILLLLAGQIAGRIELQRRIEVQKQIIAEREQAERALRQSEQRLRLALDGGWMGVWELDFASGDFVEVSPVSKALLGLAANAPLGFRDFLERVHPDDRARVEAVYGRESSSRSFEKLQYRVYWGDGQVHWLSDRSSIVLDTDGQPRSRVAVVREITARKDREARREQALQEARLQADSDPLTGLLNHRAFHKKLEDESLRAERDGAQLAVAMLDLDNFKFFNEVYGHITGDQVLRQVAETLHAVCRDGDTLARFGGDEFSLILPSVSRDTTATELEARLRADLAGMTFTPPDGGGQAIPLDVSVGVALCRGSSASERSDALHRADDRLRQAKTGWASEAQAEQVRQFAGRVEGFAMLDALVTAVNNKDRYTRRHSEDVMMYSLMIAREMHLTLPVQETLAIAALLHDVGKIGVADRILRKPGQLSPSEFDALRDHPQIGASLVATAPGLELTLDPIRCHHERWDGKGYPEGLSGDAIPLLARILAVADGYSAMTTDRPYRKGMTPADAVRRLRAGAGSQWDAACVQAFERTLDPARNAGIRQTHAGSFPSGPSA